MEGCEKVQRGELRLQFHFSKPSLSSLFSLALQAVAGIFRVCLPGSHESVASCHHLVLSFESLIIAVVFTR